MALPTIKPKATMEEAWAEGDHMRAEGNLVVILTAEALYGEDVHINWLTRTVVLAEKGE